MDKEKLELLIPKTKCDIYTIKELMELTSEELDYILPQLIDWLADMNWPVARELPPVVTKYPDILVPHLKRVLSIKADDDVLKYEIIETIIPMLPDKNRKQMVEDLRRIYFNPTDSEKYEELLEYIEYLKQDGVLDIWEGLCDTGN